MKHTFAGLPLWDHFEHTSGANHEQIALVENLVQYALPLVERYAVAFPTYTLHNRQHQYNVINLMGKLLGHHLLKTTSLECAILLLSAVYHDIGMVYNTTDLAHVAQEESFEKFLYENTGARLAYEENNRVASAPLIEWYCRWNHAERVWVFLDIVDKSIGLKWLQHSFKHQLGHVCWSHGKSLSAIIAETDHYPTQFLNCCDLKFCAVLLRIADILDFDNTRTPASVYEYLGLEYAQTSSDMVSKEEWGKHLQSQGFDFEQKQDKVWLHFKASPQHPFIEIGIRKFLKIIGAELDSCTKFLQFVSERWRNHPLPQYINTDNIQSENYRSGDYHFSLDENKILDLLTGEGLYSDDFVFLRELIQNAIDTTRHRQFSEQLDYASFRMDPIRVSCFTDAEGYQWVNVDDFGMGMNEDIIVKHLLRKGNSYYTSDKFKLDVLDIKNRLNLDFSPISRFGIGLLSCFIIGDRIEINTRYKQSGADGQSFRLSMGGRDNVFIIQSKQQRHSPLAMPVASGREPMAQYRKDFGTTISVRLKSDRELPTSTIEQKLSEYVLCAPIPVMFEGKVIGGNPIDILETTWCKPALIPLEDEAFLTRLQAFIPIRLTSGIQIELLPVNITKTSLDPDLKGQLVIISIRINDLKDQQVTWKGHFFLREMPGGGIHLCFGSDKYNDEEEISCDVSEVAKKIQLPDIFYLHKQAAVFNQLFISHNGISIRGGQKFTINALDMNQYVSTGGIFPSVLYAGMISLQDRLLPDVTVSRNEIKSVDFAILSHVLYALRDLNHYIAREPDHFGFLDLYDANSDHRFSIREIRQSGIYENAQQYWEDTFYLEQPGSLGTYSITTLKSVVRTNGSFTFPFLYCRYGNRNVFCRNLVRYAIHACFAIQLKIDKQGKAFNTALVLMEKTTASLVLEADFEALLFVDFSGDTEALSFQSPVHKFINRKHPLIVWLNLCYPGIPKAFLSYATQLIAIVGANNMDSADKAKYVNNILIKLEKILPQPLRPPASMTITPGDFIVFPA